MRRVCAVIGIMMAVAALPGRAMPLQASGVAVKFASWEPVAATYRYRDLKISKGHRKELVKQGEQYMIPLRSTRLHFLANGDVEEVATRTRYILSQDAVHNYGNMGFWLDAYSSRTKIIQAYSLTADGKRVEVDPKAIQLQTEQSDDIFTDSFRVIVPYSNLKPFSILVLQTRTLYPAARDVMPWSRVYYPQAFHVRDRYTVEMSWDNDRVKPAWKSDYPYFECHEKGRTASCEVTRQESFADDPNIPRYEDTLPQLVVAKAAEWPQLVAKMKSVVESRLDDRPAIRAKARGLVAGIDDERKKIQRLYEFVADDIRYVGLEHGFGGIIPRHTAKTLARGYGDCKDKASLFVNMARMVGLNAYPVLTSTQRRNAGKLLLPAASYFNHMVACVDMRKGDDVCVDLTDPYSSSRQLSGNMQGAVRLDIKSGVDQVGNLPRGKYVWDIQVNSVNRFSESGAIKEKLRIQFNAATATWARGILRPMTLNERKAWGSDTYHKAVSSSANPKISISGISNKDQSVAVSSETLYKDIIKKFSSFKRYSEDEFWLKYYYASKKSANENHSYTFDGMHYRSEIKYILPDGYEVSYAGAEMDFATPYGHFERKYKNADNELTVVTEFSLPNNTVPLPELPRFNHFIETIMANQAIEFGIDEE
jgi:transglutaminase-like putative cysteine protease